MHPSSAGPLLPLHCDFSPNDMLHRKIGGILAQVQDTAKGLAKLKDATWDLQAFTFHTAMEDSYYAILKPRGQAEAVALDEDGTCSLSLQGRVCFHKHIKATVLEHQLWMSSGSVFLKLEPHAGQDITDISSTTINTLTDAILQSRFKEGDKTFESSDTGHAWKCALGTLEVLARGDSSVRRTTSQMDTPDLSWDGTYHRDLLALATCHTSRLLLTPTSKRWIPANVRDRLLACFEAQDRDLIKAVEAFATINTYESNPIAVFLLEGLAGSEKTAFLVRLVGCLLDESSWKMKIHFSAPANIPINAAVEKLAALNEYSSGLFKNKSITDFIIIRGHTQAVEQKHFTHLLRLARTKRKGMADGDLQRQNIMEPGEKDSVEVITATLYQTFADVWGASFPDLPADMQYSTSRTFLLAIGLNSDPNDFRVYRQRVDNEWCDMAKLLLMGILRYIKANDVMETAEAIELESAWLKAAGSAESGFPRRPAVRWASASTNSNLSRLRAPRATWNRNST